MILFCWGLHQGRPVHFRIYAVLSLESSFRIHMFQGGGALPRNLVWVSYQGVRWYAVEQGASADREKAKKEGYPLKLKIVERGTIFLLFLGEEGHMDTSRPRFFQFEKGSSSTFSFNKYLLVVYLWYLSREWGSNGANLESSPKSTSHNIEYCVSIILESAI